jgi:16S rRNA (cytosine967-C5)-methyltransferase
LRVNTKRCDLAELRRSLEAESLSVEPAEISAHTLRVINLPKNVRISELTAFKDGLFFIQDESSAIVAELLDPKPGMMVVDLCSAPGGKACAAAMSMKDQGLVLAFDKAAKRLERVQENVQRLGLQSVKSVAADALYPPIRGVFERVLLDAPCSGIGTLARKADIRWNRHNDQFAGLAEMQLKMLAVAFGLLAPAGKLVYSTCSIDSEENEAVVNKFLQQQPGCVVAGLPDWLPQAARSTCGRFFVSLPHRFKMTGAFAAVLARKN